MDRALLATDCQHNHDRCTHIEHLALSNVPSWQCEDGHIPCCMPGCIPCCMPGCMCAAPAMALCNRAVCAAFQYGGCCWCTYELQSLPVKLALLLQMDAVGLLLWRGGSPWGGGGGYPFWPAPANLHLAAWHSISRGGKTSMQLKRLIASL